MLTEKEKKISKERAKLEKHFETLPKNKMNIALPLIQNAAFMKVTLEELQDTINQSGCSEEYKNGENQYGRKASADLQAYNSMMKVYNSVSERLEKMLPAESASKLTEMFSE